MVLSVPNKSLQRTALRAAAELSRSPPLETNHRMKNIVEETESTDADSELTSEQTGRPYPLQKPESPANPYEAFQLVLIIGLLIILVFFLIMVIF